MNKSKLEQFEIFKEAVGGKFDADKVAVRRFGEDIFSFDIMDSKQLAHAAQHGWQRFAVPMELSVGKDATPSPVEIVAEKEVKEVEVAEEEKVEAKVEEKPRPKRKPRTRKPRAKKNEASKA